MFRFLIFALSICFSLTLSSASHAKKLALLIGNQNYELSRFNLKNPHNDVQRIGKALKRLGFQVKVVKDGSLSQIQRETRRYARRLRKAGKGAVGFFYYSGHGAMDESTRTNYIVPTDVSSTTTTELWDDSIRLSTITNSLKGQARNAVHIVVFDACRSELTLRNPDTKSFGNTKGFAAVEQVSGMLISYATAEGKTATDLGDGVGHYARILSEELVKPGREITTVFRKVQLRVSKSIGQEPWLRYNALPELYLAGRQGRPVIEQTDIGQVDPPRFTHGYKFDDCNGADWCPKMIVVRGDTFTMGSFASEEKREEDEGPVRQVTIGKFAVGRFEVTRREYHAFVQDTGHNAGNECVIYTSSKWKNVSNRNYLNPGFAQSDDHPATCISWDDAQAYVKWMRKLTGKKYRLLTESEWEYVASAKRSTAFWWGNSISTDQANYNGNGTYGSGSKGIYRKKTVPVNSFKANPFGLYNVHGNVWEWVEDCWHGNYKGAPTDGSAWLKANGGNCNSRVLRGGSWGNKPQFLRARYYLGNARGSRSWNVGFRVARAL